MLKAYKVGIKTNLSFRRSAGQNAGALVPSFLQTFGFRRSTEMATLDQKIPADLGSRPLASRTANGLEEFGKSVSKQFQNTNSVQNQMADREELLLAGNIAVWPVDACVCLR